MTERQRRPTKITCPYEQEYAQHFGTDPVGLVHGECGFDLFRTHDTLIIENILTGQRYKVSLWVEPHPRQGRDFLRWRVSARDLRKIPDFVRKTESTGLWNSLNSKRSNVYLSRLIMAVKGESVEGLIVHHKDGNTLLGDWPSNLEVLTVQEHERIHSEGEAFYHAVDSQTESLPLQEALLPHVDDSLPEEGQKGLHYPAMTTVSGCSGIKEEVEDRRDSLRPLGLRSRAKLSRKNSRGRSDFAESIGTRLFDAHSPPYPHLLEDLHGCRGSPGPKGEAYPGRLRQTPCHTLSGEGGGQHLSMLDQWASA